jgi:hypothetical protein
MTSYAEIFNRALKKCDDPSLAQWPEEELSNEMYGWLQSAIAKLPQLRTETAERDVFEPEKADILGFAADLSDVTKEALALGMAREWLAPQIASTTLTWQRYSKKEGYNQKDHLNVLMELDEKYKLEIKKLLRDNTYIDNEYFD